MKAFFRSVGLPLSVALLITVGTVDAYSSPAVAATVKVTLSGDQEVPPVNSTGSGGGTVTVEADKTVSGSVTTTGIAGTMAHIHEAAAGTSGPVVIPLTKNGDTYTVPAGSKLSEEQYTSFKAGNLYVNVHTEAHPNGEIRGQLKP